MILRHEEDEHDREMITNMSEGRLNEQPDGRRKRR